MSFVKRVVLLSMIASSNSLMAGQDTAASLAFRDATFAPFTDWDGPVFKLSHEYPQQLPAGGERMPWLKVDVPFDRTPATWSGSPWDTYMRSILAYIREGQDPQLPDDKGFLTNVGGRTRWYHMPWMAYDDNAGREFVHGLTNERIATNEDLDGDGDPETTGVGTIAGAPGFYETWSVGMYNLFGAYSIGRALEGGVPHVVRGADGRDEIEGLPFPIGTLVTKLLFTNADETVVPFLKGSPAWRVHRHVQLQGPEFSCRREIQVSHLLQMDVAVVDPRSPTGWVFGTFAYDGNSPGESIWDRLQPVGVQWGNDPEAFPVTTNTAAPLKQSFINDDIGTYQHLGCLGRLNGPADNPKSSCMACHAGAFANPLGERDRLGVNLLPIFGWDEECEVSDALNKAYFSNRSYPDRMVDRPQAMPLDMSLQLFVAVGGYKSYSLTGKPEACVEPTQP